MSVVRTECRHHDLRSWLGMMQWQEATIRSIRCGEWSRKAWWCQVTIVWQLRRGGRGDTQLWWGNVPDHGEQGVSTGYLGHLQTLFSSCTNVVVITLNTLHAGLTHADVTSTSSNVSTKALCSERLLVSVSPGWFVHLPVSVSAMTVAWTSHILFELFSTTDIRHRAGVTQWTSKMINNLTTWFLHYLNQAMIYHLTKCNLSWTHAVEWNL